MSSGACDINLQCVQLLRQIGTFCKATYNGTGQDYAKSIGGLSQGTMSFNRIYNYFHYHCKMSVYPCLMNKYIHTYIHS